MYILCIDIKVELKPVWTQACIFIILWTGKQGRMERKTFTLWFQNLRVYVPTCYEAGNRMKPPFYFSFFLQNLGFFGSIVFLSLCANKSLGLFSPRRKCTSVGRGDAQKNTGKGSGRFLSQPDPFISTPHKPWTHIYHYGSSAVFSQSAISLVLGELFLGVALSNAIDAIFFRLSSCAQSHANINIFHNGSQDAT